MRVAVVPVLRRSLVDGLEGDTLELAGYRAKAPDRWEGALRSTVAEARADALAYRLAAEAAALELGVASLAGYCWSCGASNCGQDCYDCGAAQHPARRRMVAA